MTMSSPLPVVIVSLPPCDGSIVQIRSMSPALKSSPASGAAALARRPVDQAAVAEDDVVPVAGVDRVGVDAADDDVVAAERGDRVGAADQRADARDQAERDRLRAEKRAVPVPTR